MDLGKELPAAFDPRDPAYRRKLWVRVVSSETSFCHVYWWRIAAVLGVVAIAAWLGLAAAAWGFVKYRRGYTDVSFLDLAFYPVRRAHYRTGMGSHYISVGRAALERGDPRGGYAYLQAGLTRVPHDIAARRILATLEARLGRPDRALRLLAEGLPYARQDLAYAQLLFDLLLESHEDEKAIALAAAHLPPQPDQNLVHQYLALQAAIAHYHRGRTGQTERIVADWNLERSLEGQILLARCDWDAGYRELALQRLQAQLDRFPQRDELYVELVRRHREAGQPGEARRFALLRQFNNPGSAGPRIDLLHCYREVGDTARETSELEAYLASFGADPRALLLLLGFAVDTRQPALADRLSALARAREQPLYAFHLGRMQLKIVSGDYRGAVDLADDALRGEHSGHEYPVALLGALRAVALFGLGETSRAQLTLSTFLENTRVRASDALLLARQLQSMREPASARRVLAHAVQVDPLNQPALGELVRLDAATGHRPAVAENLPRLLAMRKPSRAVLEDLLRLLSEPGDEPLRAQIRAALARPP